MTATFLSEVTALFRSQKMLAERAIAQLDDGGLRRPVHPETNSVAVIIKHMAGNMRSRWTDFLTSDGEKPWRRRDGEFVDDFTDRAAVMAYWESGWARLFEALGSLKETDLDRVVRIRGEPHSVERAILRQVSHYGYHVGQIVQTARAAVGDGPWETLSIPRGGSEAYNSERWWKETR